MDAKAIITKLGLERQPEGGWLKETHRGSESSGGSSTYLLLIQGEPSPWHRMDVTQIWHHYLGAPLRLLMKHEMGGTEEQFFLGKNLLDGERPQVVVPENYWRFAETTDEFTLIGSTVTPWFDRSRFELADSIFD